MKKELQPPAPEEQFINETPVDETTMNEATEAITHHEDTEKVEEIEEVGTTEEVETVETLVVEEVEKVEEIEEIEEVEEVGTTEAAETVETLVVEEVEKVEEIEEIEKVEEVGATEAAETVETLVAEEVETIEKIEKVGTTEEVETLVEAAQHEEEMNEEHSALKYIHLEKEELLDVFIKLLESQPLEVLRREAEAIKSAFYKFVNQEKQVEEASEENTAAEKETEVDLLEEKFKALYNEYRRRRTEYSQHLESQKEQNLVVKQGLIEELKALLEKQEDLQHTFPAFRDIQQRWRESGPVPLNHTKDLWSTYHHYVELFYDYVKINNELRDLDFKKNLEAKTILCEKAERLLLESSIITAFNKLQKYHEEWRELGPVASEYRDQIWDRFKNATAAINKKHQEFFEQQKEEQRKNLETKKALCEQAEEIAKAELKENKDWSKRSKEMEELQKLWRTVGFATKKENTRIFERFRAACDKFYTTKRDFYGQFKSDMQENLNKKIALCEQAESVANSEEWKKSTDKLINLQKQWKEIGAVSRKHSNAVWKRFRTACDTFFNRKTQHFSGIENEHNENLKQKQAIIAEIEAFVSSEDPAENLTALQNFQRRWTEIGFVPFKEKDKLQTAYRTALDKQFQSFKISDSEKKLIRFKNRVTEMQNASDRGNRAMRSERDKLVLKLRQLEADIALWENNIGFFAKSKNADSMIAEVNSKISKAKEEIRLIEDKIQLIEKQYN
ncbi:MAG: DUF349 domain-containing protein [Bacteroidales bacterium]|nr:DUF349 domain-containing protein [Bacteroidales bacterium]MCL2132869.1 DUF349 domain-containing protein [Bacteroidales bacterium]